MPVVNKNINDLVRFEYNYDGLITVIEGREFDSLQYHFQKLFEEEINRVGSEHVEKGSSRNEFVFEMLDATCIVIIHAYQAVWGKDVVYLEELEDLRIGKINPLFTQMRKYPWSNALSITS